MCALPIQHIAPLTAILFIISPLETALAVPFHPAEGVGFDPAYQAHEPRWRPLPKTSSNLAPQDQPSDPLWLFDDSPWTRAQPAIPSIVTGPWRIPEQGQGPPELSVIPMPGSAWLLAGSLVTLLGIGRLRTWMRRPGT